MENYLEEIKNKITNEIQVEAMHKKHKFFDSNKYHLKLEITSNYLNSISRLSAQKKIMKILEKDLRTRIHALEIKIK